MWDMLIDTGREIAFNQFVDWANERLKKVRDYFKSTTPEESTTESGDDDGPTLEDILTQLDNRTEELEKHVQSLTDVQMRQTEEFSRHIQELASQTRLAGNTLETHVQNLASQARLALWFGIGSAILSFVILILLVVLLIVKL